jgi:hypothetical protein
MLSSLLLALNAVGDSRVSSNYSVSTDTIDAGGRRAGSTNYSNDGSAGGIGGISSVAVPTRTIKHGYIGQLYEVAGLTLAANPTNINEGGARQLNAATLMDDATILNLSSSAVAWNVVNGPIVSITAGGLAMADIVYQETNALVQGTYAGNSAVLGLLVLDINNDNFGSYAGDGLADDWQVQYFGLNNAAAAPTADPDDDKQNNLFEYTANTIPTNSASFFSLALARVTGQVTQKEIIFAPRFPSRNYTVQYKADLGIAGFSDLTAASTNDVGVVRNVTDLNATETNKFYRVRITFP